jgi:hypothetical protein
MTVMETRYDGLAQQIARSRVSRTKRGDHGSGRRVTRIGRTDCATRNGTWPSASRSIAATGNLPTGNLPTGNLNANRRTTPPR